MIQSKPVSKIILLIILCAILYSCEKDVAKSNTTNEKALSALIWLEHSQMENGLLQSSENSNMVSLYDNALAAMVFIEYDKTERAEAIFNFFEARVESELLKGVGGFSQFRDSLGKPNNHRWMGDNAWLLIALNNYKNVTGSDKYGNLSEKLTEWLISLQDSDGGIWGGFESNGAIIHKTTEGNIDAFNAVSGYTSFHKNLLVWLENDRWDPQDNNLVAWPGNEKYLYAMDLHPWAYCIFEDFPETALITADRYLTTQIPTASSEEITGYCFDADKDVIWFEGTGEMIVAMQKAGMNSDAEFYISEMEKAFITSVVYTDAAGLPYASSRATGYGDSIMWEGVDTQIAISSCAWYLFAKKQFDPFDLGYSKNIPSEYKFWLSN